MNTKHPFDDFGINLFDEHVMKERLPHPVYTKWETATRKEDALGDGKRRYAFYALVSTDDRLYCRKARQLCGTGRIRSADIALQRQKLDQGRRRCFELSQRRTSRYL